MFRIAVCSSQMNDKNETSRTIQKWIKRNTTADAEICQVESVEELQNIMETQPDKYNFCIMDMPALKSAFEAQTEQKKHPLLIYGTDSVRRIFVEDIMYAENSLRRITYTLYNRQKIISVRRAGSFESAVGEIAKAQAFMQPHKSFFCPAPVHFRTGDRPYPDGRRKEDPGSTEPPDHGTEQVSALSHTKNESIKKNSTDCLMKMVCGVFLYAYRGLRRNKAQCAETRHSAQNQKTRSE